MRVPAVLLTGHNVSQAHILHDRQQILISLSFLLHVSDRVGVDHLVAKGARWQIRSLRNVENLVNGGLGEGTRLGWPEFTQDSEQT